MKALLVNLLVFSFTLSFAQSSDDFVIPNNYYIAFYSDSGAPGHAFVAFGYEDNVKKQSVSDGAWGLYPKTSTKGLLSVMGTVPGKVVDDYKRDKDNGIVILVSKEQYEHALSIKKIWSELPTYKIKNRDCLSFLIEIAESVEVLTLPDRSGLANFPNKYVKKLTELNKHLNQF